MPEQIVTNNPDRETPAIAQTPDELEIVQVLNGYKEEGRQARLATPNSRDETWRQNLDLYWNRMDFAGKAAWQAKEVLPEVASFVDRFAASLKEALVALPEGFYTVYDPGDDEGDIARAIKTMTDLWLSRCGRNIMGHIMSYPGVFEEQIKLGALMACSSIVTWKEDEGPGRVAIETQDPRFVWLDSTYRNLYRVRQVTIDRHDLIAMSKHKDAKGKPLFNLPAVSLLVSSLVEETKAETERLTGTGQEITSTRAPVILDEYLATIVHSDGRVLADRALCVVANGQYLIRGPEKNPFWHGKDWLLYSPLINVPLSPYGKSYVEDFANVARTLNELTNLILDAVFTMACKAYAIVPSMLANPQQAQTGVHPNKTFLLEEGFRVEDFMKAIDLGEVNASVIQMWQALKNELKEAAGINEIGLGQFAPKGRTSAFEVATTQQSSALIVRSVAQTVEMGYLNPQLDLSWKTGLQHVHKNDGAMREAVGSEMFDALLANRRRLISRPITFQAQGLSRLLQKAKILQALLRIMQIVGANELILQEFFNKVDIGRLVETLFELSDIDLKRLQMTERERLVRSITEPLQAAQQRGAGGTPSGAQKQIGSEAAALVGAL